MNEKDNENGLFILRIGTDDIMVGKNLSSPEERSTPTEYAGIFTALCQDIYNYTGKHISLLEWLRERDFKGVRYDANNDYN